MNHEKNIKKSVRYQIIDTINRVPFPPPHPFPQKLNLTSTTDSMSPKNYCLIYQTPSSLDIGVLWQQSGLVLSNDGGKKKTRRRKYLDFNHSD